MGKRSEGEESIFKSKTPELVIMTVRKSCHHKITLTHGGRAGMRVTTIRLLGNSP